MLVQASSVSLHKVSLKFYPLSCGLGSLVLFAIWTEAEVAEKAKSIG